MGCMIVRVFFSVGDPNPKDSPPRYKSVERTPAHDIYDVVVKQGWTEQLGKVVGNMFKNYGTYIADGIGTLLTSVPVVWEPWHPS